MQKSFRKISIFIVLLVLGCFLLTGCGSKIKTFGFKEASYELILGDRVTVELELDDKIDTTNIQYSSANTEIATFTAGVLKGVSVGQTTITISYKDEKNDLSVTIDVLVKLSAEEQTNYETAQTYDAKVEALSSYTSKDVEALKALVDELETLDLNVLNYVTKGDKVIEMYDKARALVIDEMIAALPEVVTVEDEQEITAAREAYKVADNSVRKYVTNLAILQARETALEKAIYDATPDAVELSYQEESWTKVKGNIVIVAKTAKEDPNTVLVWTSSDESVATVVDGVVTGIKPGTAQITATIQGTEYAMSVGVTIVDENISEALQFILDSHNSAAFSKRRLPIGSGTPNYYYDVMGSVSDIIFTDLKVNDKFLEQGNESGTYYVREDYKADVEFITVHYTANFVSGAYNNASYFASGAGNVSIHYVTGNDGVYHCLDDKAYGAWHAGDSNSRYYSNSSTTTTVGDDTYKIFEWIPTGVKYDGTELLDVVFTASDDFYFEINGKKTSIKLPETYNYKMGTDHIYNADGTISSKAGYRTPFENREPESFFNSQDFALKVIDGEYYMGPTWWSYGQVYEGCICSMGGNVNSIGIETCVDKNSNLWYTWQITAKLIAQLMEENNLGIERVKGHHFFDGKDCPQPMLENDLEVWYKFIDLIQAEYERRTKFADYEFSLVAEDSTYLHKNGYIKKWGDTAQSIGYTVTITNGDTTEEVTLYTLIPAK